jgi:hypothetical protein
LDHIKRIADGFGRQAQTFDTQAEKTDDRVAGRFRTALGDVRQGKLIIACGPGVVTAALAPGAASVVARVRPPSRQSRTSGATPAGVVT